MSALNLAKTMAQHMALQTESAAGVLTDEQAFLNAAKDFAQAHINCDEMESAYESDPNSGSEEDTAELDGMYNVTKRRLVEAYRALSAPAALTAQVSGLSGEGA